MKMLLLGNEAVARGAYESGATVATAYPGTPSTEITEALARYEEIYSEWSTNEKVALEVAAGASFAGARAICSMKHVGLNVAADPLFTLAYTGVNGGLVIAVADDPGMHSSQNEQDSRFYARAARIPMLEPSDSQECKDFVKEAFYLSEKFDTPVLVRLTTRVAHSRSMVELGEREDYRLKEYVKDEGKYVMMPAMARKRHGELEKRMAKIREFADESLLNRIEWGDRSIGVITSGVAYQYAREALGDVSYLKLGMVYPLPRKLIARFAKEVETLYVIEELEPFIEDQVRKMGIKVIGKELFPVVGELSARLISERVLGKKKELMDPPLEQLPVRPPVMCPGCPHRAVFYVLKKLRFTVNGDIGCYTLGALPPARAMDTCLCMGASVGMAHGMEKARGADFRKKTVAVIGDSTFIHSGITPLIDLVYNKGNSTVIILDNSITAMTGHQHNPSTGYTIKGEPTIAVDLVKLAEAVGVKRVRLVDPFELKELEKILKEETQADGPSVIIAKRPCALLKQVKFGPQVTVDRSKCKYCKACMVLGCPAISDTGDGIKVDEALCVGCGLCIELCRFGAFVKKAGEKSGGA